MKKTYILFLIVFSGFLFSQQEESDSLKCLKFKQSVLINTLLNSYKKNLKPKEENNSEIFGCGMAYIDYKEQMRCNDLLSFMSKYNFLPDEIRIFEKNEFQFKYLDVIWIENKSKEKSERYKLKGNNLRLYNQWKLRNTKSSCAIIIIVDKINNGNEYIQMKISYPNEMKEIIKNYTLNFSERK
ncbi:hypothetical protein ACM39_14510 [Chryseobacterium sp. FH2]|uniref:hypothetical protein n=1 Tax=Chryseobacterium sp. FH2 TaxID=1674291 RepID=UPI00065AE8C0|nr:hypothetical protein [Chryseobacterium sp. FH2]KMQ67356.1 hypothetical protein ACM39_14510 [Chryseobacterium sp. FH2]